MTVKVGFVGCGARATREMQDLVQMPNVKIAALCDVSEEAVAAGVGRFNQSQPPDKQVTAPAFTDTKRMLDAVDLDAVYVALPPFAHGAIEHAIIDAGKAIMIEKPLGVDMPTTREIDAHIREKGVVNAVGYQGRYGGVIDQARDLLKGVPIGLVMAMRLSGLPGKLWWRIQEQSGGMLIEQHTHGVDLMRYLAGDVATVYAAAGTQLLKEVPQLSIDDVSAASVTFVSGAVGTIVNSCAVQVRMLPNINGYVHVVAKDLVLAVASDSLQVMRPGQERQEFKSEREEGNFKMNQAFIRAVETGDRSGIRSTYSDSLKTHAITVGAVQSARDGRPVDVVKLVTG